MDRNAACLLSGLPIRDGDPVAGVLTCCYRPLSPPILGRRDADSGIADLEYGGPFGKDRLTEALSLVKFRDYCGHPYVDPDPAVLVAAAVHGKVCGPGAVPVHLVLFHRNLYYFAVNNWKLPDGAEGAASAARRIPGHVHFPDDAARARAVAAWTPLACLDDAMRGLNRAWVPLGDAAPLDGRTREFHGKVAWLLRELLGGGEDMGRNR